MAEVRGGNICELEEAHEEIASERRQRRYAEELARDAMRRASEAGAMLSLEQQVRVNLADQAGTLADENRALLVENATLRRKLERLEAKRGRK